MTSRTAAVQIPVGAVAARTAGFAICMAATTLPTPLYDLYATRFGFHTLMITVLFAVYAVGVVLTLVLFGQLSDAVGRRPVMLSAVAISVVSSLILASAQGPGLLFLGRVVSGLAAGLMTGAGTAGVIDLFPPGRRAAGSTLAVAANTCGLALGTLFAGVLADLASHPLVTPYLAQAALGVLACVALLVTPRYGSAVGRRFRLARLRVPAEIRGNYVRAVLSGGTAFAVTGVLTSVSALFLFTVLHDTSHVLAGSVVAIVFIFMASGQLAARRTTPRRAMLAGCACPAVGVGVIAAHTTLITAGVILCVVVIALAVAVAGFEFSAGRLAACRRPAQFTVGGITTAAFTTGMHSILLVAATIAPAPGVISLAAIRTRDFAHQHSEVQPGSCRALIVRALTARVSRTRSFPVGMVVSAGQRPYCDQSPG